jgi:hypothetical protein
MPFTGRMYSVVPASHRSARRAARHGGSGCAGSGKNFGAVHRRDVRDETADARGAVVDYPFAGVELPPARRSTCSSENVRLAAIVAGGGAAGGPATGDAAAD